MRIVIVEDEQPAARRLKKMLEELDPEIQILATLDSVESTVRWLQTEEMPDLMFMDIMLADGLSFDIFQQVPVKSPVIFTTSYDEYALQAFKVNSVDYILKPITKEDLERSIQKFQTLKESFASNPVSPAIDVQALAKAIQGQNPGASYKSRFLVKHGQRLLSIPVEQIAFFMAEDKVVFLFTIDNHKYVVDYSLDELENLLDSTMFFRANRQFTIPLHSIDAVHSYFNGKLKVQLKKYEDKEVIVSREKASVFKQWLDQ